MNNLRVGNLTFGRALTTAERESWEAFQKNPELKRQLGLKPNEEFETTAIIPGFSVPSSEYDTGIGTLYSEDAKNMVDFWHSIAGVNVIQDLPEGEISAFNKSPYDSTNFSLGTHKIDIAKLTTQEYGELLTTDELDEISYTNKLQHNQKDKVQYENIFAPDGQDYVLHIAFDKFKRLPETSALKQEFSVFKEENDFWLKKDALFEAEVAKYYGERDINKWAWEDKNLFATKDGDRARIYELEQTYSDVIDYFEFTQFIADKQRQEAKANYNSKGIKICGDIPIGFSQKDIWTHRSAFYPDIEGHKFGVQMDGSDDYACWSPAINFDKLYADAGDLIRDKYKLAFKRYDGVRIDAAWQLISPVVVKPTSTKDGAPVGKPVYQKYLGDKIIKDIIMDEAQKAGVSPDKIYLELLGGKSWDCLDDAKAAGVNLIHITRYANDGWGRVKYYEAQTGKQNRYQNMTPGSYTIGAGTHDDIPAIQQAIIGENRANLFAKDLHLNQAKLKASGAERLKAIFAELFTTRKQFITLPDLIGVNERINTPNTVGNHNWTYRSEDYEREYYKNLTRDCGLNLPDALSKAIKARNGGRETSITQQLDVWAKLLKKDTGIYTQQDANERYGENYQEIV